MATCPACQGKGAYAGMSREAPARYRVAFRCVACNQSWHEVTSAEEAHRLREHVPAGVMAEGTQPGAPKTTKTNSAPPGPVDLTTLHASELGLEPKLLVFLSAPVRPIEGETVESNLARVRYAYKWLCRKYLGATFLAPWILNCEVFTETPDEIAIGMRRNKRVIEACDELWLLGNRLSSGMKQEATWARELGKVVKAAGWEKLEAEEWKG